MRHVIYPLLSPFLETDTGRGGRRKAVYEKVFVQPDGTRLRLLAAFLEEFAGAFRPAVVMAEGSVWPMERAAEAQDVVEGGHVRGKVVITIKRG